MRDFLGMALMYGAVAALIGLFYYPAFSGDRTYMVEWVIVVCTAVAGVAVVKALNEGWSVVAVALAVLWVYGLGVVVRRHAYAQLPCSRWEKSTCWSCTETEITQSGEQCLQGETFECEECRERVWRSDEWD
jgi:hypothetical protein